MKSYDGQLVAWAVDRAIETLKQGGLAVCPDRVCAVASQFASLVSDADEAAIARNESEAAETVGGVQ